MTKAEVKSMMNDADFNGDGKLDYEEVFKKLFFFNKYSIRWFILVIIKKKCSFYSR